MGLLQQHRVEEDVLAEPCPGGNCVFTWLFPLTSGPVPGALDLLWFGWSKQGSSSVVGAVSKEAFKPTETVYTKYVATFIRCFSDLQLARNPTHINS